MTDPKTSIASYVASGGLVIFGMSANDFAVMCGLLFAFFTFVLNWYYKHKHLCLLEQKMNQTPFPSLDNGDEV